MCIGLWCAYYITTTIYSNLLVQQSVDRQKNTLKVEQNHFHHYLFIPPGPHSQTNIRTELYYVCCFYFSSSFLFDISTSYRTRLYVEVTVWQEDSDSFGTRSYPAAILYTSLRHPLRSSRRNALITPSKRPRTGKLRLR